MKHLFPILSVLTSIALTSAPTIAQSTRLPEAWVMSGSNGDGSQIYFDRNSVKHYKSTVTFALKTVSLGRGFEFSRISANCTTRHWRTTSLKAIDAYGNTLKSTSLPSGTARPSGDPVSEALRSACGH